MNKDQIENSISATEPDWSREAKNFFSWSPSRSLLSSIRSYQRNGNSRNPWRVLAKYIANVRHRFWSVISGADIPLNSQIGGGLLMPHPNGIVIHPGAKIGPNCLVFQQVTIGARTGSGGFPVVGGHVDIGAGAKILGSIDIGSHARIGANSVVLESVPEYGCAVGVPAKVVNSHS